MNTNTSWFSLIFSIFVFCFADLYSGYVKQLSKDITRDEIETHSDNHMHRLCSAFFAFQGLLIMCSPASMYLQNTGERVVTTRIIYFF